MNETEFLKCEEWRKLFAGKLQSLPWLTAYSNKHTPADQVGVFCALLPNDQLEKRLTDYQWDLQLGSGGPGMSESYQGGKTIRSYDRLGFLNGIEPLVHYRYFHHGTPAFAEISEEFRFFHQLYQGKKTGEFLKSDDAGNEEVVARVSEDKVEIRTKEIRQFLAVKNMHLSLQVSVNRFSAKAVDEFPFETREQIATEKDHAFHWGARVCDWLDDFSTHAYFLGKKLLPPLALEECGQWPFRDAEENYPSFIIGTDEDGKNIEHTCEPDKLANFFGANKGSPFYVTPVHFRNEVLERYYSRPQKYSVEDGYLRAQSLWGLRMDNDHRDRVVVLLGDLGRDLPSSERAYWRTFNIPPEGNSMSGTAFARSFRGQFADPKRPDLAFKAAYAHFAALWKKKFRWDFFLPLAADDTHHLITLRIPQNDQGQFDAQVLSLTKLLIDSLNEQKLAEGLALPADARGIAKLGAYLDANKVAGGDKIVAYLKDLQWLRSSGAAHRKGSNYEKAAEKFDLENRELRAVAEELFAKADEMIATLGKHFLPERKWE